MIDWSPIYEWTYDQVMNALKRLSEKDMISLDCEHSSAKNMKQIIEWATELGYRAEINNNLEIVRIWRS